MTEFTYTEEMNFCEEKESNKLASSISKQISSELTILSRFNSNIF